jgi:Kef-type K+ transport system membrane component KefB
LFDNALFLFQIAVIVGSSWLFAAVFRRFGQPRVVGEMAAGIALGPTLLGWVAPGAYHFLFPPASLGFLNALSQSGLVMFVFLVGVRVDFEELRAQGRVALTTSIVSVTVPLAMGLALAFYLYPHYGHGKESHFALFLGTAMCATAFPVLARILLERNLLGTPLGSVAIMCAGLADVTAWILLAVVVALVKNDSSARPLWLTVLILLAYGAAMLVVRKLLNRWSKRFDEKSLPLDAILVFSVLALLSGAVGEIIGVHALVGAFVAGLITPRKFRTQLIDKLETVTILLLMPLFFVLTGVRTNLIFSSGAGSYLDFALIMLVAVGGKWGGTMVGAKASGMSWADSCQLGLMMNTRGLVELIVLNVGLDTGILSPPLFSMMVLMALVTTAMTMPLMDFVERRKLRSGAAA